MSVLASFAGPRLAELLGGPEGHRLAEALLNDDQRRQAWTAALGVSPFLFRQLQRYPELLAGWLDHPKRLEEPWGPEAIRDEVGTATTDASDPETFMAQLRRTRQWLMAGIAFRDIAGWSEFATTSQELTALAEASLDTTVGHALQSHRQRFGTPRTEQGKEATFSVLGMGKLGGGELNFSSDIDLIFIYTDNGETDGDRALDNGSFFTRVGRSVIQLLSEATKDGFAFRVDLRLRPHGEGGPLAHPVAALEQYYQLHGREWERYALVKARPVAGDRKQGERLLAELQPFVFRRYLDFGAVEAVRELKAQIQRQVASRSHRDDIKLGRVGIREIEFIVQAFQLLYGGRLKELRQRSTLGLLDRLGEQGLLPGWEVERLKEAYRFLRHLENRLQMVADRQCHSLPDEANAQDAIAASLGFEGAEGLLGALDDHRERVQEAFDQIFAAPQTEEPEEAAPLERLWRGELSDDEALRALAEHGYLAPERALETLKQLAQESFLGRLTATGRDRLDRLMPLVLGAAGETPDPATTLTRMVELLEAIGGRTTYFALLAENPVALGQVVQLCGGSPFLARFLGRHPMLLDEVLDPEALYADRSRASREATLERELGTAGDLEEHLNALRRFKNIEVLHVAARDLQGRASLEEVSRGLTETAELALSQALTLAWQELTERFGPPRCADDADRRSAAFAVIGMGKLGGQELGYGSDLDLLFLHDSAGEGQITEGGTSDPIDNARFFARLGQRLIHFLTTLTPEGALYSIDMRLRPGGKSGPLVVSVDHFRTYQLEQAWIWEHQALLRGRPVALAGSSPQALEEAFHALRMEILAQPRDSQGLLEAVRDMRARMLSEHGAPPGTFDIKQDRGGLVDIEFLIQYLCLRHGNRLPDLLATSNRAALAALAQNDLLEPTTAGQLDTAYVLFRTLENRVKLFEDRAQVRVGNDPTWREQLDRMLGPEWSPVAERIEEARRRVSEAFDAVIGPP